MTASLFNSTTKNAQLEEYITDIAVVCFMHDI